MIIDDLVWKVIENYYLDYTGTRLPNNFKNYIEQHCEITPFDGGVFIAHNNEFDLFVVPEKRGHWKIRSTVNNYLSKLQNKYGKIIVKIYKTNETSLRLAKYFQFKEIGNQGEFVVLERN